MFQVGGSWGIFNVDLSLGPAIDGRMVGPVDMIKPEEHLST